jgi:hypothetical protein
MPYLQFLLESVAAVPVMADIDEPIAVLAVPRACNRAWLAWLVPVVVFL